MPQRSVYVNDDLDARMRAAGEDQNWSEIARKAFVTHLGELARRKEIVGMQDVIDRLRASDEVMSRQAYDGGQKWAKTKATAAQLRMLEKMVTNAGSVSNLIAEEPKGRRRPFDQQMREIGLESNMVDEDNAYFLKTLTRIWEDGANMDEVWVDFVRGALDVWNEVKSKL
jgi:hypothetical protein